MPDDRMTARLVATGVALVLGALALLHAYWAAGGHAGRTAAVPTRVGGGPLFDPGPGATLAVAAALLVAAGVVLGRAGVGPLVAPPAVYRVGAWVVGGTFALRAVGDRRYLGFFKRVRGTRFADLDTRLYAPLCAALAAATLYVAAS